MGFAFRYLLSASKNLTLHCCTGNLPHKILLCSHTHYSSCKLLTPALLLPPSSCLVSPQLRVSQLCQPLLVSAFLFPLLAGHLRPILQPVSLWFHQGKFISKAQYKTPLWGWCSIAQLSSLLGCRRVFSCTMGWSLRCPVFTPSWVCIGTKCTRP